VNVVIFEGRTQVINVWKQSAPENIWVYKKWG